MKALELINTKDPIIAHVATKLTNEGKGNWNYDFEEKYFISINNDLIYDVKTLQFHQWDESKKRL